MRYRFRVLFVYSDSSSREAYAEGEEDLTQKINEELKKIINRGWSVTIHISNLDVTEPEQL